MLFLIIFGIWALLLMFICAVIGTIPKDEYETEFVDEEQLKAIREYYEMREGK